MAHRVSFNTWEGTVVLHRSACLISMIALSVAVRELAAQETDPLRDSVVRVHVTHQRPDPYRPWRKRPPQEVKGSGVVIEGRRILTNAHVVNYATEILVESGSVCTHSETEDIGSRAARRPQLAAIQCSAHAGRVLHSC